MATRKNLPRILKEIQDVTSQLYEEFTGTGDPITDDNNTLHRFCVKLEYLLQTCIKEKTLLGGTKCYWHWMYDSLKRTKGLSDGLKFVRANKEIRTSHGRGRALVRYSLVHQTLADSFQNCLMNATSCIQYLKSDSILMNATCAKAFVDSLYDFNAVHFDLNSKGYDLDTAWPTFASKCYHPSADQWRAPRSASLGSLNSLVSHVTATSLVMDNPQLRGMRTGSGSVMAYSGTGSSGPPSVDQRVEDLVLELNESDKKIQEQEIALNNLEAHADCIAKSANEKEDILARVISDLESRNQNLQDAMSHMSTEFQNRDHTWEQKYQDVTNQIREKENKIEIQRQKICLLEDKRNLEDTVSTKMSRITSGFSGTDDSDRSYLEVSTPLSATASDSVFVLEAKSQELRQRLEVSENERYALETQINSLRLDLAGMPRKMENEKQALSLSLSAKFEEQQIEWRQRLENVKSDVTSRLISEMIRVLPADIGDEVATQQSSAEQFKIIVAKLNDITTDFSNLRRKSNALQKNQLLQSSYDESLKLNADELLDKCNILSLKRDEAVTESSELKEQLIKANKELQNYKLKLEAALSDRQHSVVELKDHNFQLQDELNSARKYQAAMAEEMRTLQQNFEAVQSETASLRERYRELENQIEVENRNMATLDKDLLEKTTALHATAMERDDLLSGLLNAKTLLSDKQDELTIVASSATESSVLQLKLQNDLAESRKERDVAVSKMNELIEHIETMKMKSHKLEEENSDLLQQNKDLIAELDDINAKDLDGLVEIMQQQIDDMDQKIQVGEQEKVSLRTELDIEKSKVTENIQKSASELSETEERYTGLLKNIQCTLEDTELKCKTLTENLADKDREISIVKSSLDLETIKLEEEKLSIEKALEELTGENESRKRMIKTYDKKIEKLQQENSNLLKKSSAAKDSQEKLSVSEENCKALKASLEESEERLITIVDSLEREREKNIQLEGQILQRDSLEGKLRTDIEDSNSIANDLKSRIIELLQEKDALWKECDELRYYQKLQEEGEETKEKWMQDQEARYCLHCGTQFTFIVRKHHCRICGKIFCNNCSKQWIITKDDGKRDRCCLSCLESHRNKLDIQVLSTSLQSPSTPKSTTSSASINEEQNKDSDLSFDAITEQDLKEADDSIYNESRTTIDDSFYGTPNTSADEIEMRYHGESVIRDSDILRRSNEEQEEKVVLAGESLRVPVLISSPGTSLYWSFTTDRSIDFQLSYTTSQDDEEQPLMQRCRCNSHSEPVEGEIVTKKSGIYILEFDNRFSRFMSKDVKYRLRVKE